MVSSASDSHTVEVADRRTVASDIVELTLRSTDGAALPSWAPGAHIDLLLPSGTVRQYSLCGHTDRPDEFVVAVLKETGGRGGSVEVHAALDKGVAVSIRGPRNHFELHPATHYLFLAGGIGVTPILAMARQAARAGIPWTLLYGGRSRSTMAYTEEFAALPCGTVRLVPQDEAGHPDFAAAMKELPEGGAVYACGPEPMLAAAETVSADLLPPGTLHLERFGAKDGADITTTGEEFEVELAQSGCTLTVGADDRLIDVVRKVAPQVPFSCEEGYCGSCETRVVAGIPDHRDQVLSDEEREANDTMMICVGRSLSKKLVLDL
ncbi:PDR/VanB family oxidoreductase [Rhodococcus sp. NPDC057529]|uniref:PDR/VanB family oxidoreductase n=1 Tax=Rhodococcus sp. NPDC057529 TaxID=3346158 RepID=UPI003672A849